MLVLADGMGGHLGGAIAAKILVELAKREFYSNKVFNKDFFENIIINTSKEILAYKNQNEQTDPHTTAVIAVITNEDIYYAHIGDSRLYLFNNTKLIKRTKDHSVVQMLFSMGEISEEEMATHPDQNKLLKNISSNMKSSKISYSTCKINEFENVILCSDGFWEFVKEEEMISALNSKNSKEEFGKLINLAKNRANEKSDNISLAVWKKDRN